MRSSRIRFLFAGLLVVAALSYAQAPSPQRAFLDKYCVTCHNQKAKTADLALDQADVTHVAANPEIWEKVIRKLNAGAMPPAGMPRPDQASTACLRGLQGHQSGTGHTSDRTSMA